MNTQKKGVDLIDLQSGSIFLNKTRNYKVYHMEEATGTSILFASLGRPFQMVSPSFGALITVSYLVVFWSFSSGLSRLFLELKFTYEHFRRTKPHSEYTHPQM